MPRSTNQLLLNRYCGMVSKLYEELEKDIIAGTFDNTEDIELEEEK